MPLTAVALVLVAACTHASWNLLAKRAAASRNFIWFYSTGTVIVWAPAVSAVLWFTRPHVGPAEACAFVVSAMLHLTYSVVLQRGYRVADLSVVYPLARGVGPLLSFLGAVLVLGEHPSAVAVAGAALVVTGVFLLAGGPRILRAGADRRGVLYGVLTGAFIAAYTVWDGWAVKVLAVTPILIDYAGNSLRCLILSPAAWRDRATLRGELRTYWREALGVGLLAPGGYILVLHAMTIAPLSHVAPARELSMLLGAWFGARLLKEGDLARRLVASGLILGGVLGLAFG